MCTQTFTICRSCAIPLADRPLSAPCHRCPRHVEDCRVYRKKIDDRDVCTRCYDRAERRKREREESEAEARRRKRRYSYKEERRGGSKLGFVAAMAVATVLGLKN